MGMIRADRALVEADFHEHDLAVVSADLAALTGGNVDPLRIVILHKRIHGLNQTSMPK